MAPGATAWPAEVPGAPTGGAAIQAGRGGAGELPPVPEGNQAARAGRLAWVGRGRLAASSRALTVTG